MFHQQVVVAFVLFLAVLLVFSLFTSVLFTLAWLCGHFEWLASPLRNRNLPRLCGKVDRLVLPFDHTGGVHCLDEGGETEEQFSRPSGNSGGSMSTVDIETEQNITTSSDVKVASWSSEGLSHWSPSLPKAPSRPPVGTVIYVNKHGTDLKAIVEMRNPHCYLLLDEASRNIRFDRHSEPELYVSATITVIDCCFSPTPLLPTVSNRVAEYSFFGDNRPPVTHQILVVTKVLENGIEVVGTGFRTATKQTHISADLLQGICEHDLVMGTVYQLPPGFEQRPMFEENLLCYRHAEKEKMSDRHYVLDSVRPLTEEELYNASSWCQADANVTFDSIEEACMYVRDPCVALLRLEIHELNNQAIQANVERRWLDDGCSDPRSVTTACLDEAETLKLLELTSGRSQKWPNIQVLMCHPQFHRTDVVVNICKFVRLTSGSRCQLTSPRKSRKLFDSVMSASRSRNISCSLKLDSLAQDSLEQTASTIIENFDDFYSNGSYRKASGISISNVTCIAKENDVFVVNGRSLDESQLLSLRTAQQEVGWTCVSGPPGGGKTLLVAGLAVARLQSDSSKLCRVLVSAISNRIVKQSLDEIHKNDPDVSIRRDYQNTSTLLASGKSRQSALQALASPIRIVGATTNVILSEGRNATATHLILQEASRLSPATALALYCVMPSLTHVTLFGDSKQLGPSSCIPPTGMIGRVFGTKTSNIDPSSGENAYRLMGELQRMQHKEGAAKCLLDKIYSYHPGLVDMWLRPIYGPSVTAGTLAGDRDLAERHALPVAQDGSPSLLIDLSIGARKRGSELTTAVRLIDRIKDSGVAAENITVVCLDRRHQILVLRRLKGTGSRDPKSKFVTVSTFSRFQLMDMKENKIVILLLTRTINKENDLLSMKKAISFLSNPDRATVLLSRAQHALYVIGDSRELFKIPFWTQFRQSLTDAGAWVDWNYCPISVELTSGNYSSVDGMETARRWWRKLVRLLFGSDGGSGLQVDWWH